MDESLPCLNVQFEEQAKRSGNEVAVVAHDGRNMTFNELERASAILAENLRHHGCTRDSVVGIYIEKSIEFSLCYISILRAGGAYFPIELSYPTPLLNSVLADATPVAVITNSVNKQWLPDSVKVICIEDGWEEKLTQENAKFEQKISKASTQLDDLAYVVYSSGTTGKPKGINIPFMKYPVTVQ